MWIADGKELICYCLITAFMYQSSYLLLCGGNDRLKAIMFVLSFTLPFPTLAATLLGFISLLKHFLNWKYGIVSFLHMQLTPLHKTAGFQECIWWNSSAVIFHDCLLWPKIRNNTMR